MSSEATPGPWTIEPDVWPHHTHIGPNVAEVKTYDRKHCEANARLIAAAPELLEAANAIHAALLGDSQGQENSVYPAVDKALALLTSARDKAKGRS